MLGHDCKYMTVLGPYSKRYSRVNRDMSTVFFKEKLKKKLCLNLDSVRVCGDCVRLTHWLLENCFYSIRDFLEMLMFY